MVVQVGGSHGSSQREAAEHAVLVTEVGTGPTWESAGRGGDCQVVRPLGFRYMRQSLDDGHEKERGRGHDDSPSVQLLLDSPYPRISRLSSATRMTLGKNDHRKSKHLSCFFLS